MTVLKIPAGATYSFGFTWMKVLLDGDGKPVTNDDGSYVLDGPHNLDGCSVRLQIRKKAGSEVLLTATSESAFSGDPAELDEEAVARGAGRVILQGADGSETGHIRVRLTDEDTAKLDIKTGVFALEVTWPQQADEIRPEVDRPLEGTVEVGLNDVTP